MTRPYKHTRIKIRAAENPKGYQKQYYLLRLRKKHRKRSKKR